MLQRALWQSYPPRIVMCELCLDRSQKGSLHCEEGGGGGAKRLAVLKASSRTELNLPSEHLRRSLTTWRTQHPAPPCVRNTPLSPPNKNLAPLRPDSGPIPLWKLLNYRLPTCLFFLKHQKERFGETG